MARPTLRRRLIVSYLAIVLAVTAAGFVTVQVLVPRIFEQGMQARQGHLHESGSPGTGSGRGGPGGRMEGGAATTASVSPVTPEVQESYDRALNLALIAAVVIGLLLALGLGRLFSRRILRHLESVASGTRQLAAGRYDATIPEPEEAELADLAASVNVLAATLGRTAQTRARLVSDLAHELRNPLSTIAGYMEGLIDGILPADPSTYQAVATEAHRLQRLTKDLSLLARAQEGAIEYATREIDLGDPARRVVDGLRPQFELNDVALTLEVTEPLPVLADPDRVAQALTNLLGNALAHTPGGGAVRVGGARHGEHCTLEITDTGAGIPASEMDAIFERFTRLDHNRPGTGIGLNIARTLIRGQGGDITVASPGLGHGATFTLLLPGR